MKIKKLFILIIICLSLPCLGFAEGKNSEFEGRIFDALYGKFKTVESFSFIHVAVSENAEKIGINEEEITNFLKLRFKNNFAEIKYNESAMPDGFEKSEKEKGKLGYLWCKVLTVGDDYPVAYHIRCIAGNYNQFDVWETEYIGYGNKSNVPETIKKTLSKAIEELAITFFKVRGEL